MFFIKKNFFLLLFLILSYVSYAQSSKKVLFIGNSYTASNNLPQLTQQLALSVSDNLEYDQAVFGGYTLQMHTTNTTTLDKINSSDWDYVVLQEQSQLPSFHISQVETQSFPYAFLLDSLINANNACTKTMFYMTWGRKNGDASNCAVWPPICTYEGMDSLLRERYTIMADSVNGILSPVGALWRYLRTHHPEIELYSGDESHPSMAGSYAAACSFYSSIFMKDPTLITDDATLSASDAMAIRTAAKLVVFDSLEDWNYYESNITVDFDFNYTPEDNSMLNFENLTVGATSYLWDFGDGNTDTAMHPTHQYTDNGTYTITLFAINECGDTSVYTKTHTVTNLSIHSTINILSSIYPNPVTNYIYIDNKDAFEWINIINPFGRVVHTQVIAPNISTVDCSKLPNGIYFIQFFTKDKTSFLSKIVKY